MEVHEDVIRSAPAGARGAKRPFTRTGEPNGIAAIDDCGHHPVENAAVLKALRQADARGVIAVFQPHHFSRLTTLIEEFCHSSYGN